MNAVSTSATTMMIAALSETATDAVLIISESVGAASEWAVLLDPKSYRIVVSGSLKSAQRRAAEQEFAAAICVLGSAREGQLEPAHCVRAQTSNAATPIVLIVPPGSNHVEMMRALDGGPVEVLEHPIDEFILCSKVKMFVDMHTNLRNLRQLQENNSAKLYDSLTNLPLRALLLDRATQAMRMADRSGARVALAVLDISHHREVRDTLGPASADELLRQIALRLTGALRRSDTVARVGDDEYAVVVACDTRDGVETVTSRLDRAMSEPFVVGAHRISIGGGIGVAMFPEHGYEPELLLERATSATAMARQNSLGHLFYDAIEDIAKDPESSADSAEMNAEELFKVSAV
jgi:diguanylate cyclase (GGDEF)-like protein